MAEAPPKCVACAGKGWCWRRGRQGEPHMIKDECRYCKGSGLDKPSARWKRP